MPEAVNQPEKIAVSEPVVIYFDDEDGIWVAHGLRTDQIGSGDRIVDALADQLKGVDAICEIAQADASIAYLREAPEEIQALYASAKRLPAEIYEVAHRMARGDWPDYITIDIHPDTNAPLATELQPG